MRLRQQGAISAAKRQSSLNRADDILPLLHLENWGSVGSRREGLTLAADRRQLFGWPMTRNNARIITKYLREAGWSEVTALRQELAASKARLQEMGRHNATEVEHFRAICRRIEDSVSIMTHTDAARCTGTGR